MKEDFVQISIKTHNKMKTYNVYHGSTNKFTGVGIIIEEPIKHGLKEFPIEFSEIPEKTIAPHKKDKHDDSS